VSLGEIADNATISEKTHIRSFTDELNCNLERTLAHAMEITMQKLEKYIDEN
jgi:hypothetical protein